MSDAYAFVKRKWCNNISVFYYVILMRSKTTWHIISHIIKFLISHLVYWREESKHILQYKSIATADRQAQRGTLHSWAPSTPFWTQPVKVVGDKLVPGEESVLRSVNCSLQKLAVASHRTALTNHFGFRFWMLSDGENTHMSEMHKECHTLFIE